MKKLILIAVLFSATFINTYSASYTTVSNDITSSTTWSGTVYVSQTININSSAKVTVTAGTVIKLGHGVSLLAPSMGAGFPDNELRLNGTSISPIIITSIDDNSVGETISGSDGSPEAGDWGSVWLWTHKMSIQNTKVYYGGGSSISYYSAALMISSDSCVINNTIVSQSDYNGISFTKNGTLDNCSVSNCRVNGVMTSIATIDSLGFYNSTFKNNGNAGISATNYAGDVRADNCSFENNGTEGLRIDGSNSSLGSDSSSICYINNCSFKENIEKAVYINNMTVNSDFSGNTMDHNGTNAFYLNALRSNDPVHLFSNDGIPFATGEYLGHENLTIHEGTIIKLMDGDIEIPSTGSLYINGTESNPVIFTSIADDDIAGDTNNDTLRTTPTYNTAIICKGELNVTNTHFYYSGINCNIKKDGNTRSIRNSHFDNNCYNYGAMDFDSCYFKNNTIAFRTYYDTCYVSRCVFENNDLGIDNDYGLVLRDCLFDGNLVGLEISDERYNNLGLNNSTERGNNTFLNSTGYDIKNTIPERVYAYGNIFEGLTSDAIDNKIFDDNEDNEVGAVIFDPIIGNCNFLGALKKPTGDTIVCLNDGIDIYTCTFNDSQSYAINWVLHPAEAGTLIISASASKDEKAAVYWNTSYQGEVKIYTYLTEGSCTSPYSDSIIIERIPLGPKPIITQDADTLIASAGTAYEWCQRLGSGVGYLDTYYGFTDQKFTLQGDAAYVVKVADNNGCFSTSDDYCTGVPKLPKPIGTGTDQECQDISLSRYSVVNTSNAYVKWAMDPSSAGTILTHTEGDTICKVSWNQSFVGDVQIWAYLRNGLCTGENSDTLNLERVAKPAKPIVTQSYGALESTTATGYQWYKRVGTSTSGYLDPIIGATTQTYTATDGDTYAVLVSSIENCATASDDFTSIGKPTNPTGITEVCENISNNVYTTTGDNTDAWFFWNRVPWEAGNLDVTQGSGTSTATINWEDGFTGTMKIYVYLQSKSSSNSGQLTDSLTVTRVPLPAKPIIEEKGDLYVSTSDTIFQWYKRVGSSTSGYLDPIIGATKYQYKALDNDFYAVGVSSIPNCTTYSEDYQRTNTALNDAKETKFKLSPNPSKGQFILKFDKKENATITIYDSMGRMVYSKETTEKINNFDLDLKAGIYFIRANSRNAKKLIIE